MKNINYMNALEIKNAIKSLAVSQGYYSRLYYSIESSENPDEVYEELAAEGFKDPVDLVMYLEF